MARIAGGVSTWLHITLKFFRPSRAASRITSAVGGVVVLETNGEEHHLFLRVVARQLQRVARRIDHAGCHRPRALALVKESPPEAGTRIVSP